MDLLAAMIGAVIGFGLVAATSRLLRWRYACRMAPVWRKQGETIVRMVDEDFEMYVTARRAEGRR